MKTRKQIMRTALLSAVPVVGLVVLFLAPDWSWAQQYEAYYSQLINYPRDANPGWHEACQGVANDQNNWFITQVGALWKISVTHDLNSGGAGPGGIVKSLASDMPTLAREGYNHMGDPDYYEFGGQGYLLVPVEESTTYGGVPPIAPGVIAAFRAVVDQLL